ncbi:hypothetical protein ElyMa_006269700 [Elysia marginata]|uniref:Reverse transcriptase domain-containing protein n=1 Tax=Elysia marginata TaxID=1093978 RepID=A0AAV4HCF9_9GAST|nr:hypothetical protein ElyMa_006269700 [Elysia marginata]
MIAIEQWRAVIGCFAPVEPKKRLTSVSLTVSTQSFKMIFRLVSLSALLIMCGDVELNPGPKANSRPTSKQSTLTGGLMIESPRSLRTEPTDTNEILVAIQQLGNRFDSVDTKISNIDSNVQEMKAQNVLLQDQIKDLVSANTELKQENDELQKRLKTLEDKMDDVEARSRRNNIFVHGLPPDNEHETWDDCEKVVRKMINSHLEIDDASIQIDRAHRLRSNNGTGAIIVRIAHYKDKENIMKNKKKLKDTNIHISDDYTPRIREIRRKLGPFLNKFRNEGKKATMVYDHLIVDGARLCWDPITGTVRSPLQTQHQASDRAHRGATDRAPHGAPDRAPRGAPDRAPQEKQSYIQNLTITLGKEFAEFNKKCQDKEIDAAVHILNSCIRKSAPSPSLENKRNINSPPKQKSWFDLECIDAKREKYYALSIFHNTNSPADLETYLRMRRRFRSLSRFKKQKCNEQQANLLIENSLKPNSKEFWNQVRALICSKPKTSNNIKPSQWWRYFKNLLNPQGDTNTDSHDQTVDNTNQNLIDEFNDDCYSENAGLPTVGDLNVADNHNVNCPSDNSIFNVDADAQMTLNNCAVNDIDEPISQVEIVRAIRKIKTGKACGPDGIPPELYKCEFCLMIDYLIVLFNTIYESGIYPKEWTNSMIFPLHEKGSINDVNTCVIIEE